MLLNAKKKKSNLENFHIEMSSSPQWMDTQKKWTEHCGEFESGGWPRRKKWRELIEDEKKRKKDNYKHKKKRGGWIANDQSLCGKLTKKKLKM